MNSDGIDEAVVGREPDVAPERGWIAEQADLLALEEGLTGHPLTGAYICVNKGRPG